MRLLAAGCSGLQAGQDTPATAEAAASEALDILGHPWIHSFSYRLFRCDARKTGAGNRRSSVLYGLAWSLCLDLVGFHMLSIFDKHSAQVETRRGSCLRRRRHQFLIGITVAGVRQHIVNVRLCATQCQHEISPHRRTRSL